MAETTHEASEDFVHKVKGLLEAITGKPYAIAQKFQLEKAVWAVYFDEDDKEGGGAGKPGVGSFLIPQCLAH